MALHDKLTGTGPKKLLAIDGGGIRGVIALEVLARIEDLLGKGDPDFRLADYFDLIAGTSTGAIIATGLSLNMSVGEIRRFYLESGAEMFDKAGLLRRYTTSSRTKSSRKSSRRSLGRRLSSARTSSKPC
jgi:patatin-like phospholipase/acyl hydrolase